MKRIIALFSCTLLFFLFTSGQDTLNQLDNKGLKHGYWKKYDVDTLKYEGRFEHGVPTGEFIYYHFDKSKKATTIYSENGTVAHTVMYFNNGFKLSEGVFIKQKREGLWKNYDGYDHVIAEVEYKNGMKNGRSVRYYQEGDVLEVTYFKDNKMDGSFVQYYPDSIPKIRGTHINGQRNGIFTFYHANGNVYMSGNYVAGLRENFWVTNDEDGKLIVKQQYKNGDVIAREVFQKDKDPLELQKKSDKEDHDKKGTTTQDNGVSDPRFDGF